MLSTENHLRYQRQIQLKEFGVASQIKLFDAKVLIIGAGGLGCPALQYLAAAGIGTIGIVDFDVVDISNLQRQILYTTDDIGKSKVKTAAERIKQLNPDIQINILNLKLQNKNALEIISAYDLVIDGSDNFSTRYLINDACVLLNKPFIYGAVLRFEGQVGVFNFEENNSNIKTNYRDLFPEPPVENTILSCNEAGVLGVVPALIGTMQATEAIKIITGIGKPICNKIISYNVLNNEMHEFEIFSDEKSKSKMPKNEKEFLAFNYDWICGVSHVSNEISAENFDLLIAGNKITVIDVRELSELPIVSEFPNIKIPMNELEEKISALKIADTIVVFCQTGIRSLNAVKIINKIIPKASVSSLHGGIIEWIKHQNKIHI